MFITEFEQSEEKRHVRKTQRPWLECRKIKPEDMGIRLKATVSSQRQQ